jgi:hypothetical protein
MNNRDNIELVMSAAIDAREIGDAEVVRLLRRLAGGEPDEALTDLNGELCRRFQHIMYPGGLGVGGEDE